MPGKLSVISGPDRGRSFEVEDDKKFVIGRGEATATKLKDPTVSRSHCQIVGEGVRFTIENLGAASGTLVNGKRVTAPQPLRPGDLVRVGDTELRFMVEGTAAAAASGVAEPPEPLAELIGTSVSHYQIARKVARGASGMVFQATDTKQNRTVAFKVLWPEFSKNEEEVQRFVRAMKTMMPIRHENLVALYGAGKAGPYCWIAMEFVDGVSLTEVIEEIGLKGMLDWTYSFRVATHISRALQAAFGHQIVHRNISPQNILVRTSDKLAKLGDLMLAKALEGTLAEQITRPGQLVGDVVYMSPERTHSTADIDCRSDIYSLGATLYALLTGRPPFEGGTLVEAVQKIRSETPVRPKKFQFGVPDYFEDAVMKMLAKDPNDRFQTPTELLNQLERIAKFQTRAVWDVPAGADSAAARPMAGRDLDVLPVPALPGTPVRSKPAAERREAPLAAPPSTHFFRNILAGLLDDEDAPAREPSGAEKLRELVGTTLYHYEVKRVLAKGKTSLIFYAEQPAKRLQVALKVLFPEFASKEDESQRFVRAVKTMMGLHHPNIVQLHDAGRTDGYCWMAMEYVKGASLTRVIKEIGTNGMLDWRDALLVAVQIGRGLEAAYERQIIHRNITPQNILIRSADHLAKLADLMLAKAFEGRLAQQITSQGELVGDMVYMAPERTQAGADVDQRSDIYSLGATVYTLVCGRPPFDGRSLPDLVGKIRRSTPARPRDFQASIPELFERVLQRSLAKRPEDRYETPAELLTDLERIAANEGIEV
jgi:serine/threonine protein kinase